ncbi:aspartate aminotransferase, cytoplasmic-like isoform X2 [Patiria miniata]|uniref:Aspartate aminotransferase n=1 Tax=Patiria miniata TaxID=46514 RepID=A0A914B363_PATMI|nr:aspartate aminotransferase, cytoplasmic-like isoform X2 [Patiria miniata]
MADAANDEKRPRLGGSRFVVVSQAAPVPVFALRVAFKEDKNATKYNVGPGAYRTDDGVPWVLPVVKDIEKQMAADESLNHEYLPVLGIPEFTSAATKMLLGENSPAILENRAFGIQSLSGTGAVRLGCQFLIEQLKINVAYVSDPTWTNHINIFNKLKFSSIHKYRYWNAQTRSLDIDGMLEDLENAPADSLIMLHACAHNPTGVDPTQEQWKKIAEVVKRKNLFPFFDCAYIGFATGDIERDSWAVNYFVSQGMELMAAMSFAKNFGLYNERVGNLVCVVNNTDTKVPMNSQLTRMIRTMYSSPPSHGARIVSTALNNPALFAQWKDHIKTMSGRIFEMRQMLYQRLQALGTPGKWNHVIDQIGMFSYTGLGPNQVDFLLKKYHIYAMKSGRINMCAITTKNVDYIAKAIHEAVTTVVEDPKL